jgi:divalent metal cation (Fe/Co/Zn/Cd) transporter
MGDMILVDVHIEVDAHLTVKEGHDIVVNARNKIIKELPVLNVMTHVDPV